MSKSAFERMQLIKNIARPNIDQYVSALFEDFIELHGDRAYGDDPAVLGGIGTIGG